MEWYYEVHIATEHRLFFWVLVCSRWSVWQSCFWGCDMTLGTHRSCFTNLAPTELNRGCCTKSRPTAQVVAKRCDAWSCRRIPMADGGFHVFKYAKMIHAIPEDHGRSRIVKTEQCISIYQHDTGCLIMEHLHLSLGRMQADVRRSIEAPIWLWLKMDEHGVYPYIYIIIYIYISIIHCVLKKDSAVAFGLFPSFSCWPKAAVLAKDAELLRRLVSAASLTPRMSGGTYHGGTFESCLGLSIINHPPIYWGIPILGNLKF